MGTLLRAISDIDHKSILYCFVKGKLPKPAGYPRDNGTAEECLWSVVMSKSARPNNIAPEGTVWILSE